MRTFHTFYWSNDPSYATAYPTHHLAKMAYDAAKEFWDNETGPRFVYVYDID